jgi:beta-lactam-binding protein with PASTA domain
VNCFSPVKRYIANFKTLFLISFLAISGLTSVSAQAEIRVLAAGGGLLGAPYATEEIITNGDVVGTIDRPAWSVFRELTTADIIANYDVFVIPWNTDPALYDFDWNTRLAPILASGMGVIWEAPMTTGTAGSPLFTQLGNRYLCDDGSVCWIPDTPLNVLSVTGITEGVTGDFGSSTGYFTSWDSSLDPFIDVDAVDLGTVVLGLYGQYGAGRIIITHNEQDTIGSSTGTAAQVNAYNLMINKLEWVAASTVTPDPDLRAVPDTNGLTEADAITAFSNAGFVIADTFYTTTNIDASGYVVSQDPQAGAIGFIGDPVTLFVVAPQTGSPVTVPNVTGMSTANAETTLLGVGLERGQLTWGNSPTVPAGDVITQNPAAGSTDITTGWIVDLVESNGDVPGKVPYLKFLTQTQAGAAIIASGYVVGDIATASHNVIPSGSVIDQIPWSGATLAGGEPVSLVVSTGQAGAANISTPNVVGMAQATAESNITGAGLIVGTASTASSDTVAAGDVISQSPVAGTLLAAGAAVNLVVSTGPATISVPDVVELPQATAESTITSASLTVGVITTDFSDTVSAGAVISQDPVAGTSVGIGSIVNLVISDGPQPALAIVPDVYLDTQAQAEAAIVGNFLTVGTITYAYSPVFPLTEVPTGSVLDQNPSGGALVLQGDAVDLVISLGPPPPAQVNVPGVVGLSQASAESAVTGAGLVVGNVAFANSETVPVGDVISQNPVAGTSVDQGSAVNLVVSLGPVAPPPPVGDYSYYVLNSLTAASSLQVVSLVDNNSITAGGTTLNLNQNESGSIPSSSLSQGTKISGNGSFDISGVSNATDMPVPAGFAGTEFVIPHYRGTILYHLLSPNGDATATVNVGGSITVLNLTEGIVREFNAGSSTSISGVVTSDQPILIARRTTDNRDAYPVSPAATEVWGVRSNNVTIGASQDNTTVTVYASNGSTSSRVLDSGDRWLAAVGSSGSEGAGNAIHVVANKPVGVMQTADSDGSETTGFWQAEFHATEFALPVGTQYVSIVCPADTTTTITLNDGGSIDSQTCSANGNLPGKAFFGSTSDGTNISAGSLISSDQPIYLYFETGSGGEEHNLLGNVSFGPIAVADVPVPSVTGLTQFSAESAIAAAGLTLGTSATANSATVPVGDVISQSPSAGTLVFAGDTVDIVVSIGPAIVNTPDVVGLSQASADSAITSTGLVVGMVTTTNSTTVAAGNVISQNPTGGTSLTEGSSVDLVVSLGPVMVDAPSVVGLSQTSAEIAITSANLSVGTISSASSATVAAGNVISQSPNGGTSVAEGSSINLTVSTGPAIVTVPNVVGSSQSAASNSITSAGLTVGTVTTTNSTTITAGDVISQNPNGGISITEGSNVDLVVSLGPVIVNTPNVTGLSQAAAESAITSFNLSVGTISTASSATVTAGNVISQNPTGGTSVAEGSNVDIVVSTGPAPNVPPVADAGNNQTVSEGDAVNLNGTGSSDSDGSIASFSWTQTAGPGVGTLASTATPGFTAPLVDVDTVLTFSLTVTDNDGQSDTDTVNVTVQDVPPPPSGPIEVFYDSFENGWNGQWTEDAQSDWFTNSQRSTSGSRSAEVDGSASDAQLISIPIDLQGGTQASISFNWYIESGLDSGEYLAFDVSTNGGASWTEHRRLRGNVDSENTWHSEQVDLSGISSLRVRFRARMSWSREDANVDEVRVTVQ